MTSHAVTPAAHCFNLFPNISFVSQNNEISLHAPAPSYWVSISKSNSALPGQTPRFTDPIPLFIAARRLCVSTVLMSMSRITNSEQCNPSNTGVRSPLTALITSLSRTHRARAVRSSAGTLEMSKRRRPNQGTWLEWPRDARAAALLIKGR